MRHPQADAQAAEGPELLNIYKLSRLIKREQNDLYNSLRSIYEDSLFVSEIGRLYPSLPLLANLRCGVWYSPHFDGSCYFKSTDGHTGNWSFSCTRLNIHVAQLAAKHGGCIIVDATRRGKRYPDSLSKTIPIWCCVVNRALEEIRKQSAGVTEESGEQGDEKGESGAAGGVKRGRLENETGESGPTGGVNEGKEREGSGVTAGGKGDRSWVETGEFVDASRVNKGTLQEEPDATSSVKVEDLEDETGKCISTVGVKREKSRDAGEELFAGAYESRPGCNTEYGFLSAEEPCDGALQERQLSVEEASFPLGQSRAKSRRHFDRGERQANSTPENSVVREDGCNTDADSEHHLVGGEESVDKVATQTDGFSSTGEACVIEGPEQRSSEGERIATHEPRGREGVSAIKACSDAEDEVAEGDTDVGDSRALHLPLWLSPTEKAAIESRVEGWVELLRTSGADLRPLARALRKPLRPLWISQRTVIWLNEVADVSALPFTPVICLSASEPSVTPRRAAGEGSGWAYVPGAGDDEESWARGFSPALFWRNVHQVLDSGPSGCKGLVASLVEEEKVRSAMRSTGFGPRQAGPRKGGLPAAPFEKQSAEKSSVMSERSEKTLSSEGCRMERFSQGEGTEQEVLGGSTDHVPNMSASADTGALRRESGLQDYVTRIRNSTEAGTVSGPLLGSPEATRNSLPPSFKAARDKPAAPPVCELAALADRVRNEAAAEREASFSRSAPTQTTALAEGALPFDDRGRSSSEHYGCGTITEASPGQFGRVSFIGRTGLAVGSASCCDTPGVWEGVGAVLDCSPMQHAGCAEKKGRYLHRPIQGSKFDRHSLERHLPDAVSFARRHLQEQNRVLVVCKEGYDVSVCVCLAILMSCFDSKGAYVRDCQTAHVTKTMVRQGLAFLSSFHTEARPSRGNLKQVFQFLNGSAEEGLETDFERMQD